MDQKRIRYVIPSYQRPKQLESKTLKFLKHHKIPNEDISIVLRSDDEHLSEYQALGNGYLFHITSRKGIGNTHNYITEHFDEGQFIVEIDDDLTNIIDNKKNSVDFNAECVKMFNIMAHMGASYGGTYQCDNAMFMTNTPQFTTDLRYCLGCVRFRFIRKDIVLHTNYAEDFENCILHYKRDGLILKNNHIAPKTSNYSPGGCDGDGRNLETEKIDKEFLANEYPEYCKLFQRKNERWDLKLKHVRK